VEVARSKKFVIAYQVPSELAEGVSASGVSAWMAVWMVAEMLKYAEASGYELVWMGEVMVSGGGGSMGGGMHFVLEADGETTDIGIEVGAPAGPGAGDTDIYLEFSDE